MTGSNMAARPGGRILVDALLAQGVDHIFCVPGESYLAVLDALHDAPIAVTVCRQEGGAAMMADAYGKLTGRPGICFVTRGPGVTNASAGIHIASQDSTPMIVFVGQVERGMRHREAFQEIAYAQVFGTMTKWAAEIDDPHRIPEFVHRAFMTAMNGRPGPVVLALPEDVLTELAEVPATPRAEPVPTSPSPAAMRRLGEMLAGASRPVMVLGGSRWSAQAVADIRRFAEAFDLPVGCQFRRQSLFDNTHPNYLGDVGIGPNPALFRRLREADLFLLVGGRMSEMPSSSYTLLDIPAPRQQLVHVHPSAEEIGRVYAPALGIHADPASFAAAATALTAPAERPWAAQTRAANAAYRAWSDTPPPLPGRADYGRIMSWLRDRLPEDAIICNGAGNYSIWIHRFYRFRRFGTQLGPTSGSMGYGTPAAVAAKRLNPDRMVVAFAGDGCFLMNGQEFATAVQYGLAILVIVVDNGMYGTIRMHQEREYPGRVSATDLTNPDFAMLARAYGGHGETVEATEEFAPAFERAVTSGKPALIHVKVDPQAITPTATIDAIRQKALAEAG
ncbi:acetolactate synthase-1/2/3 large subunit [Tepidamorphus gemmatus]|jgi:acetolactate synthase-1/2/3 large subunit|uniref:Acetolactate synthase-1/2/3 large subunit n=1 Tax=Tepidamorphus gemmatus TaxID=747076 RepID=A0A4R3M234_9HYPH|nr:thiamine pyrophosphate-binding protein [Tepidamorphus gemmatus]TCT07211.1 acetolactate synthase-1/2/3 large subunit [Tepidamorphus gemmatus]